MPFKPKQTYSESDEREQQSIDFINGLLKGSSAYSELKYGEKGANIDGYIQLLDDTRRINGKLTVQVKTISPSEEGKYEYPCPTSLFAYAERTTDVVFLMAVDHRLQVVLWKYISRPLIKANQQKSEQETITIHFDEGERLSKDNILETINKWNSLFFDQRNIVANAEDIKEENEQLRRLLVSVEAPNFSLLTPEVLKIQQFSDMYNRLLDREFNYVKRFCYPNMWKLGIAIFEYQDTELLYSLYPINYGENSLLIKQLPKETLKDAHYNMEYHSYVDNKIKSDYISVVKERIKDDVKRIFQKPKPTPPYELCIVEYIREFVWQNLIMLGGSTNILRDYATIKLIIEKRFAIRGRIPIVAFLGYNLVHLGLVYDCINFLLNRGYIGDIELYPNKGRYGKTGMVSDWFNPELAFEKTQTILNYVYSIYTDFINKNFPYIKDKLDMYFCADYVLVNLNYGKWPQITANCFYRIDQDVIHKNTKVEFCLEQQHEVYKKHPLAPHNNLIGKKITIDSIPYECNCSFGIDPKKVLFARACFIDTFYEVLKLRLEKYVKDLEIV